MDNLSQYLKSIYSRLENFEEIDSERSAWIKEITFPLYQLIDKTLSLLNDPTISKESIDCYFYLIKCFIVHEPLTIEQLSHNPKFPIIVSNLISAGGAPSDVYFIFTQTFSISLFSPFLKKDFIQGLFDSLSEIKEEELFNRIVEILSEVCMYFRDTENDFLTVYHYHENSRLIDEVLLRILNEQRETNENKEKVKQALSTINQIIQKEERIVFYSSDLDVFVDVTLGLLALEPDNEELMFILESLELVTKYEDYYGSMYKIDELSESMENIGDNDDLEPEIREKAKVVVGNIAKHIDG